MTIETLFLVLIPTYLVLIAYGVVRGRRRNLPARLRLLSALMIVLIPPLAILGALYPIENASPLAGWRLVTLAMLASGIVTAGVSELVARRAM